MDKVCEACQAAESLPEAYLFGQNVYNKILFNQQEDHDECVKALLEAGADVNAEAGDVGSALVQAAGLGHVKRIQTLISAGASFNRIYNVRKGEYVNALTNAASRGRSDCVELLIKAGATVSNVPGNQPILNLLASQDDTACVNSLIKAGASVNHPYHAPLFHAVLYNAIKCLDLLLKSGADVNAINSSNTTALMIVSDVDCCRLLLFHRAKINMMDIRACNALTYHLLFSNSVNQDLCSLLFSAGETTVETITARHRTINVVDYLPQILIKFNLKHLCKEAIRKHLINLDPHTHLFGRIPRLRLPKSITEYLLYYLSLDPKSPSDNDTK